MYDDVVNAETKSVRLFLRKADYSPDTRKSYEWHLTRLIGFLEKEGVSFREMSAELFLRYLEDNNWSKSFRAVAHAAARAYANYLVGKDHATFEIPVRKPKPRPQRTLREEEIQTLLGSIDREHGKGKRNYAMICVLLDTALRASEICRLELKHLDLGARLLQVQIKGGKWGVGRFSDFTAWALEDWLSIRDGYAAPGVRNVFVGINGDTPGHGMTRDGLRSNFRRLAKKAGLQHFSPHSLRRSFTTMTLRAGAPTRVVQQAGRWESLELVEVYSQLLGTDAIDPHLPMNQLLGDPNNLSEEPAKTEDVIARELVKALAERPEVLRTIQLLGSLGGAPPA